MMVVPMPENIKKYKGSVYFGLSMRKLLTVIPLAVYGVTAFLFLKPYIGENLVILSIGLLASVLIPLGFAEPYGMTFEKYFSFIWKYKIQRPGIRRVAYRNLLTEAIEEEYALLEAQLARNGKEDQKLEEEHYKRRRRMRKW